MHYHKNKCGSQINKSKTSNNLKTFTCDKIRYPCLYFLHSSIERNDTSEAYSLTSFKFLSSIRMAILGVCAAIILKNQNVHMNMLQCIVPNCPDGHASKQVH